MIILFYEPVLPVSHLGILWLEISLFPELTDFLSRPPAPRAPVHLLAVELLYVRFLTFWLTFYFFLPISHLYRKGGPVAFSFQLPFFSKCWSTVKYLCWVKSDHKYLKTRQWMFSQDWWTVMRLTKRKRCAHGPVKTQGNDSICTDKSYLWPHS